jgi:hypothetical protein
MSNILTTRGYALAAAALRLAKAARDAKSGVVAPRPARVLAHRRKPVVN